ncbi:MAG TPA: calcium-binding protein [Rhizobiaceae bacterium]|nr:calcium-binding protein [Rhizobiaceae bacterium]
MAQTFTFKAAAGDATGWQYDMASGALSPVPATLPSTHHGPIELHLGLLGLGGDDPNPLNEDPEDLQSIDAGDYRLFGDLVVKREGTASQLIPIVGLIWLVDYDDYVDTAASTLTQIGSLDGSVDHFTIDFGGSVAYNSLANKTLGQMVKNGDTIVGSSFADALKTTNMQETVRAGNGNDTIESRGGNDEIYGGGGNDKLNGGTGADKVHGETGNDFVYGLDGNDTMTGGTGNDVLYGGVGADVIGGDAGNDRVYGQDGNDTVVGNAGNDVIDGGGGNDKMAGDAGNDVMYGGAGNDDLYGGTGNDGLDGGAGSDGLAGEDGADKIYGRAGADTLVGGAGNDVMHGGDGNDVLNGGLGIDTLTGGLHRDIFVFNVKVARANADIIVDFNPVNDTMALDNAVFTKIGANGALRASAFKLSTQALDANDRIIYNASNGGLFYDQDGSGNAAAIQIALLKNKAAITASDFIVI